MHDLMQEAALLSLIANKLGDKWQALLKSGIARVKYSSLSPRGRAAG